MRPITIIITIIIIIIIISKYIYIAQGREKKLQISRQLCCEHAMCYFSDDVSRMLMCFYWLQTSRRFSGVLRE